MAIALVSNVSKAGPSGGGTTSAIDTTGATLLVMAAGKYAATSASPTDSKGNTWTALTPRSNSNAFTNTVQIWYVENPTVGTGHTFTLAATALYPSFGVTAWSGTAVASVFDKENGTDNGDVATSTSQPGSVTPDADGALVIFAASYESTSLSTIDGGFTEWFDAALSGGNYFGGTGSYLIQTTAAAANPTVTYSGSNSNCSAIAVFRAAASGAYSLTLDPATLAVSAQAVTTKAARKVTADQAALTVTGQAVSTLRQYPMTASAATVAVTGQALGVRATRLLTTSPASYAVTGTALTVKATRLLTLSQAAYAVTGQDVTLTYTQPGAYALALDPASYAVTGQALTVRATRRLDVSAGAFTASGQTVSAEYGRVLGLSPGSFAVTGHDVTLTYAAGVDYTLALNPATYTVTGALVTLTYSGATVAAPPASRTWRAASRRTSWQVPTRATTWRTS